MGANVPQPCILTQLMTHTLEITTDKWDILVSQSQTWPAEQTALPSCLLLVWNPIPDFLPAVKPTGRCSGKKVRRQKKKKLGVKRQAIRERAAGGWECVIQPGWQWCDTSEWRALHEQGKWRSTRTQHLHAQQKWVGVKNGGCKIEAESETK